MRIAIELSLDEVWSRAVTTLDFKFVAAPISTWWSD